MAIPSYKIVLVGDVGTGKTALIQKLVTNEFTEGHAQTIVASCQSKSITLKDNKTVNINIWDTAGQERFRSLIANFYRGSSGIIVCYDVSESTSLDVVPTWVEAAKDSVEENVCWLLVGCKSDLANTIDEVHLKEIIEKYHFSHILCSSKSDVTKVFTQLCQLIQDKIDSKPVSSEPKSATEQSNDDEVIKIVAATTDNPDGGKKGGCSC